MPTHGRTRAAIIYLLAVLITATTVCRKTPVVPTTKVGEYDVFSAFINSEFTGHEVKRIVILNMTESDESGQNVRRDGNGQPISWAQTASALQNKVPSLKRTTIDGFREVNKQQASLQRSFQLAFEYELVDRTQLDSIFKNGYWHSFYKRFPDSSGFLTFSRVGFNGAGTQALFFLSNSCGELCGTGMYVVMEKRNGRWVVEKEIEMWIS